MAEKKTFTLSEEEEKELGLKFDSGKLPWDLLPLHALEGIVLVLKYGAQKYAPNSWQHVTDPVRRYTAASRRHQVAIDAGEELDTESGLPHRYHVACNEMFLCWFQLQKGVK